MRYFYVTCPACGEVTYSCTSAQNARANHQRYCRSGQRKPGRKRKITDEVLDEVRRRFPSTTWDWDVAMIENAARSDMLLLIAKKLERHDAGGLGRPKKLARA